ncbi:hypothetical protein H6P81_000627 [Aristolochia fimbriata]|uniref:Nucleoside phosphorylase domain-containing protein n=1 Tax=Aristolochia fimbriata TaxID=158543 RepID=A0AAV7F5H3_ARIFI|nr:hypothetical protein H6P81_000627 [Aristolochia fimbriata]
MRGLGVLFVVSLVIFCCNFDSSDAELSKSLLKLLKKVNKDGPYIGVLTPSFFELNSLLELPSFSPGEIKYIDHAGRRFRIGHIDSKKVILAMTGKGMMNAAATAMSLMTLFHISHVLHYGIAGNADPELNIGDVAIPQHWAHTGLWNWQKYGAGPDAELPLESEGDFTRDYGFLNFGKFNNISDDDDYLENYLNNVWYQPEETYPVDGTPESCDRVFWAPVDRSLFELSKKLEEEVKLDGCLNATTCLPNTPKVVTTKRGSSASIYLDNAAYKSFLNSQFQVGPVDMESAAISLISHQMKMPYLALRALSDQAGEGDDDNSYGINTFKPLACANAIKFLMEIIKKIEASMDSSESMVSSF